MKMYRCNECGNLFKEGEQAIWYEHHPYGMGTASEEFSGCPLCKGGYEEIKPCIVCGEHKQDLEEGICEECRKAFKVRFDEALHNNFTEKEIKILLALYGEWMI